LILAQDESDNQGMRVVVAVAVALAFGLGAGLGLGLVVGGRSAQETTPVKQPEAAPPVPKARITPITAANQLPATVDVATAPPSQPGISEEQLTDEERAERWQKLFTARLDAVRMEPRDPTWAKTAEAAFERDFATAAEKLQTKLVGVECHTTGCLATVEWSSHGEARRSFRNILHHNYEINCATTVDIGKEPHNPTERVQATLLLECESARIEETKNSR
jgi:hypothetical protein